MTDDEPILPDEIPEGFHEEAEGEEEPLVDDVIVDDVVPPLVDPLAEDEEAEKEEEDDDGLNEYMTQAFEDRWEM